MANQKFYHNSKVTLELILIYICRSIGKLRKAISDRKVKTDGIGEEENKIGGGDSNVYTR